MPSRGKLAPYFKTSLLLVPVVLAALWLWSAVKPWETKVFHSELARKDIPLSHYIAAGVWIGVLGAAGLGLLLAATARWWSHGESAPMRRAWMAADKRPARWFTLGLGLIVVFAAWQRWPAMDHSFWGDEGWAFCDFVHGKWKPLEPGGSPQGELRFEKVRWQQTVFGDRSGNNHWLGSILQRLTLDTWQRLTGRPAWDFDERVVRLAPLLAGLGSLVALGFLGRRLGGPILGLTAALIMTLHPQHVRFSIEARGYSLMLLFFTLAVLALLRALEIGRRRDWLLFGLLQFLVLYAWKGAIYPLAFLNLALGGWLLFGPAPRRGARSTAQARWLAANLLGAMLFLPLTVSSNLQIAKSIDEVRRRAKPMDADWARDAVSETLLGLPWHEQDKQNPHEVSLQRLRRDHALAGAAACAVAAALGWGLLRFWRRDRLFALLIAGILLSGAAASLHFKHVLKVELLTWYLLFNVPVVALLLARAAAPDDAPNRRGFRLMTRQAPALLTLAAFGLFAWPKTHFFQDLPRENHRRAWEITRGAHEARGYAGASNIHTAWLWRHTHAYDPRGDTYVRSAEALQAKMTAARAAGGEFYMIVGMRQLSEALCRDVITVLRDPAQFEHIETLWGVEHLNTMEVYRMRSIPPASNSIGLAK